MASSDVLKSPPIPARQESHSQLLIWRYYCILSSASNSTPTAPVGSQEDIALLHSQLGVKLQWTVGFCGRDVTVEGVCLDPRTLLAAVGVNSSGNGGAGRLFWLPIVVDLPACNRLSRVTISLRNAFANGNVSTTNAIPTVRIYLYLHY